MELHSSSLNYMATINVTNLIINIPNRLHVNLDSSDNIYITSNLTNSVEKYSPTGLLINANFISGFQNPNFIKKDNAGNFLISSNITGNISKYDSVTGAAIANPFIVTGQPARDIVYDSTGNFYANNNNFDRIAKYNSLGVLINANYINITSPLSMCIDVLDNMYVLTNTQLLKYDSLGVLILTLVTGITTSPQTLILNKAGNLVFVDASANAIYEYTTMGVSVNTPLINVGLSVPVGIIQKSDLKYLITNQGGNGFLSISENAPNSTANSGFFNFM